MLVPSNEIAKTVKKMQDDNVIFQAQIDMFTEQIANNETSISQLEPLATWEEIPDPIVVNDPIPATEMPVEN